MNHVPEGHPTKPTVVAVDDPCILVDGSLYVDFGSLVMHDQGTKRKY